MACGLSTTIRNDRLDVISAAIDAGTGAGKVIIYDGTRPATGAAITTQDDLATLTFSDPCAPAASGGVLTFSAITQDSSAEKTSVAVWARVVDSDDNFVMDVDVGTSGTNKLVMNTTAIESGAPVYITSFVLTEGNA